MGKKEGKLDFSQHVTFLILYTNLYIGESLPTLGFFKLVNLVALRLNIGK